MALIDDKQMERMMKFPRNRIAFLQSSKAVQEDLRNFKLWTKGLLNMEALCIATARSNHLPRVTEEQMVNELKLTGWWVE